jgi:hypothetical protein
MIRMIAFLVFGYCGYRIAREFMDAEPIAFKPVPLLPSPERQKHDAHRSRLDRIAARKRAGGR